MRHPWWPLPAQARRGHRAGPAWSAHTTHEWIHIVDRPARFGGREELKSEGEPKNDELKSENDEGDSEMDM